jgi:cell division septation protein DedD
VTSVATPDAHGTDPDARRRAGSRQSPRRPWRPTPTAVPATATQRPAVPTAAPAATEFWVQVLASGNRQNIDSARTKLEENGFPRANQNIVQARVAGGNVLYKLRVGPFPDRASADRVMVRMQRSGFPDAWVVSP